MRSIHQDSGETQQPSHALVTCLPGLESILSSELAALRIPHEKGEQGAKLIRPSMRAIYQSNLFLGTASNILLPIGEPFTARGLPELRRKISKLPWLQSLASPRIRLQVRVTTSKSKLQHSTAIQARVVAGIYEALGHEIPSDRFTVEYPPSITDEDPLVRLDVQILRDQVDVWLCAATTPLHRRGYRLETGKAPLREDLAYAMLYGAGWRPSWSTHPRSYDKLLDPLCGSGTIAIEGAGMALGLAPGRLRPPPLMGTRYEDTTLHQELLLGSNSKPVIGVDSPIVFASDRDDGGIQATKSNAKRAGVTSIMQMQTCALSNHPLWSRQEDAKTTNQSSLLVACNPPFGRRVSKTAKIKDNDIKMLLPLYQSLNKLVTNTPNASAALLVNGTSLVRRAGWKCDELFQSTHGGLSVTALHSKSKNMVK